MTIEFGPTYGGTQRQPASTPRENPSTGEGALEIPAQAPCGQVPQDAVAATEYWLALCNRNPADAVRGLREVAARAPEKLVETVLVGYRPGRWAEASPFLERILSGLNATVFKLCDPAVPIDQAVLLAKALTQQDSQFDARFAKRLLEDGMMGENARHRGLAVLEKLGSGSRLIHILIQLLRNPDNRIRSKAALLFGKTMPTRGMLEYLLKDKSARVRANFIEGLWASKAADFRSVFRRALKDPNHRVAGNGLMGLYKLDETRDVHRHISRFVHHPDASFRAMAAWVMGQTGEEGYLGNLRELARDPEALVRCGAIRALRRINLGRGTREVEEEPRV